MKFVVVAVRDRAANVYAQPMCVVSKGSAIRSFSDQVNDTNPNNMLNKHPEDFDLYLLGMYDDNTGKYDLCDSPEQIAVGKDLVVSSK